MHLRIAQIDTPTNIVSAVVRPSGGITAPAGKVFIPIPDGIPDPVGKLCEIVNGEPVFTEIEQTESPGV